MNDRVDGRAAEGAGREDEAAASRRVPADVDQSRSQQLDGLLDMLDVLDSTMGRAGRAGDTAGVREVAAARAACWLALADLAERVNPEYALACRSVARREQESAVTDGVAASVSGPPPGADQKLNRDTSARFAARLAAALSRGQRR